MRVFPDTNVFIAALATRGICADLVRALLADHEVLIGAPVLSELRRNLVVKLRLTPARADHALAFLDDLEHVPAGNRPARVPPGISAADAAILECALLARADALVTGDRALLALARHGNMPIVSPREMWSMLKGSA